MDKHFQLHKNMCLSMCVQGAHDIIWLSHSVVPIIFQHMAQFDTDTSSRENTVPFYHVDIFYSFVIRIGQRDTKYSIVSTCYSDNNTNLTCVMFYYDYLVIRYYIRYCPCVAIINASISSFSSRHFTLQLDFVIYSRSVLLDFHREKYFRIEKIRVIFLFFFFFIWDKFLRIRKRC